MLVRMRWDAEALMVGLITISTTVPTVTADMRSLWCLVFCRHKTLGPFCFTAVREERLSPVTLRRPVETELLSFPVSSLSMQALNKSSDPGKITRC